MAEKREMTPEERQAASEAMNRRAKEEHPGESVHVNAHKEVDENGFVKGTKIRIKVNLPGEQS